jgi:hypothetical protein
VRARGCARLSLASSDLASVFISTPGVSPARRLEIATRSMVVRVAAMPPLVLLDVLASLVVCALRSRSYRGARVGSWGVAASSGGARSSARPGVSRVQGRRRAVIDAVSVRCSPVDLYGLARGSGRAADAVRGRAVAWRLL